MTAWFERALAQYRLVLLTSIVVAAVGWLSWVTMPRQEDPDMTTRWGTISVAFPGADPETIERLVVDPIEDGLEEVVEIRFLASSAQHGFASLDVVLADGVASDEIDEVWKRIEDAVARVRPDLPAGASEPIVDKGTSDLEAVVVAVTGSNDRARLRRAARDIRKDLLALPEVSKVKLAGDPGDRIVIEYSPLTAKKVGLPAPALAAQLDQRNAVVPAGSVRVGDRRASLAPVTELQDTRDVGRTPIRLPSGSTVPLESLARIERGPRDPAEEIVRYDARPAVALGIVPKSGIHVVEFGKRLRTRLAELETEYAPLALEEITFQPDRVETRIDDLARSLLTSMLIIGGLLLLSMGLRMGLVVTSIVPLVALSALAIYAVGGGVLHQMSVAALVIALGMLVDNAIVVAENVQRRLDEGAPPHTAGILAVRELATPLLTATGTTVAAFIPMLLAEGGVGEFTRAIPILVILVLVVSFFYAVLVTPIVARWALEPATHERESWLDRFSHRVGVFAATRSGWVALGISAALAAAVVLAPRVEQNFFPGSDRNQVLVTLQSPEGTHIDASNDAASRLEQALLPRADVVSVATFVGRSAPHFYYNVQHVPRAPHFAQLLVTTTAKPDNEAVLGFIREFARDELAHLQVVAAALEQGPGVAAPIEVRLRGTDLAALERASAEVMGVLREIPGTRSVHDTMSLGAPQLDLEIDDAAAARLGVSRRDVAQALGIHTDGHVVGALRTEDEPVDILLRSPQGENTPVESIEQLEVLGEGGRPIPVGALVHPHYTWRPARYAHWNGARVAEVRSHLELGTSYSTVMDQLRRRLPELDLPSDVDVSFGGEAEGADEANSAMFATLPLGLLVLVGFLMVEFNSFRRVAIVLTTVPLAAVGVIPGLILGGQPFGFMSLLGVVALAGVVVNNAIVLLDVVDHRRDEGASVVEALVDAVRLRTRPILLTTMTTVAGLLPLALSGSALWPPLAWAMISGLTASTALTLLLVPALYRWMFPERNRSFGMVTQPGHAITPPQGLRHPGE